MSGTRNMLEQEVTLFNNAFRQNPQKASLSHVLETIQNGTYQARVEELRKLAREKGKSAYTEAKKRLPAFTASGEVDHQNRLITHSGLLQLDFDELDGTAETAREKVSRDPHVAAAFISPSGNGLKVLVPIFAGDHAEGFRAASTYFKDKLSMEADKQVKEPGRLCFVSDDPHLYRNPRAEPIRSSPKTGDSKTATGPGGRRKGSVNLLPLFAEVGMLGEKLDEESGKFAVKCPWSHEHSDGAEGWTPRCPDTVIFTKGVNNAFKCLHRHCADRGVREVCEFFEVQQPGSADREHQNVQDESEGISIPVNSPWDASVTDDHGIVARFGPGFHVKQTSDEQGPRVVDFNPHYWTARYAEENLVTFDPSSSKFHQYDDTSGLWTPIRDEVVRSEFAAYLLRFSREAEEEVLLHKRDQRRLGEMLTTLKSVAARDDAFQQQLQGIIHLKNGMLHLDCSPPELRAFSHRYYSRHQCPIVFDERATCPRFLNELVRAAMSEADMNLLRLFGGMYLLGRNFFQKLLILTGVGGSGKGTIVRILQNIIGRQNVKHLRTSLLSERFELDDLDQATLLVGSDVSADFLSQRGAAVIKALTGGDPLAMEAKGGAKRVVIGEHNVLITCNSRLRVSLEGDASAWARRICIIHFGRTPATGPIADFDKVLLRDEGPGILNWLIVGAAEILRLVAEGKSFPVSKEQAARTEDLLSESDSLRQFVREHVARVVGTSATVDELLHAYENFCAVRGWVALGKRQFEQGIGPLMMEFHNAPKRNDVMRSQKAKRGFANITLLAAVIP